MDQKQFLRGMARLPVTSVALVFGLLGYLLIRLHINVSGLNYAPPGVVVHTGEIWRLITPVFKHYGEMHIIFNALWIWELGRRIEIYFGSLRYLLIFLLIAFASNFAQFGAAGSINFGGLSGVVYGCLGFLLIARFVVRHPVLTIPDGLYVMMIIFMALGYLGVLDILVQGKIGNAAHLGGFLMGLALGVIFFSKQILQRVEKQNENQ